MIYDLSDTTTSAVNRKLVDLRENGSAIALGRVLTLIVVTEDGLVENAITAANSASREHPCRVITLGRANRRGASRLDAQIRVGGDAGASEVIVLRLYGPLADHGDSVIVPLLLPDAPIVVWWPGPPPEVPVQDPIGRMAQRRITDSAAGRSPIRNLHQRAASHAPGDTDLAWTRVTLWRALLAASLDQPPYERVTRAVVNGSVDSPSTDLLAAWLALTLRCPVKRERSRTHQGLVGVELERPSGSISLQRPNGSTAQLTQPGQMTRRISLPPRADSDCLAEELRRLDPDDVFGEVITKGLALLDQAVAARSAKPAGTTMEPAAAEADQGSAKVQRSAAVAGRRNDRSKSATSPPAPETVPTAR